MMDVHTTKWTSVFQFPLFNICITPMPTAKNLIHDLVIRLYHLVYQLQGEAIPSDSSESGEFLEFLVVVAAGKACASHTRRMYIPLV